MHISDVINEEEKIIHTIRETKIEELNKWSTNSNNIWQIVIKCPGNVKEALNNYIWLMKKMISKIRIYKCLDSLFFFFFY